jgi:hypothetical protein
MGTYFPPEAQQLHTLMGNGYMRRPAAVEVYPPATERQLRATEERLGFPLPNDLRLLYTHVGNGGLHLGICHTFHGAIGGCREYAWARSDGRTFEALVSHGGWRLHPRIEEALLRHPDRYIIVDSMPEGFLWIAEDSEIMVELDPATGRVYSREGRVYLPDKSPEIEEGSFDLLTLQLYAPSLGAWFELWLDKARGSRCIQVSAMPSFRWEPPG